MIVNKTFYIVKNDENELVAIFTNEGDCEEFIDCKFNLHYTEVSI